MWNENFKKTHLRKWTRPNENEVQNLIEYVEMNFWYNPFKLLMTVI